MTSPSRTAVALTVAILLAAQASVRAIDLGDDPPRIVADALDGADEKATFEAEATFHEHEDSPLRPALAYGISWMRALRSDYAEAAKALERLPSEALDSPPFVRLRLWLALQRRDREEANHLFLEAAAFAFGARGDIEERRDSAALVGHVAALSAGCPDVAVVAAKNVAKVREDEQGAGDTVKQVFRAAFRRTTARTQELKGFVNAAMARSDAEAIEELAVARKSLKQKSEALGVAVGQSRSKLEALAPDLASAQNARTRAVAEFGTTKREVRMKTGPGNPGAPPTPPIRPASPMPTSIPDVDQSNQAFFAEAMVVYQAHLAEYRALRDDYVKRLAAWKDQQKLRLKKAEKDVEKANKALQTIENERDKIRGEVLQLRKERDEAAAKVKILETIAASDPNAAASVLFVPASFDWISPSAERSRVLRMASRVASNAPSADANGSK